MASEKRKRRKDHSALRKGAPPDGPVHRKSGSQVAVPGAPDHAGGHHRHHGLVPVGPVGTVRLPLYGYSPGVCGRISAHHLVVGAGLPGGVLAVQPVQQHLAVRQRGRADADHTGLCASGRAELCMRGAVWGAYAPGPIMCGACSSASSAPPASAFSIAGCGTCATGRLWPGRARKMS